MKRKIVAMMFAMSLAFSGTVANAADFNVEFESDVIEKDAVEERGVDEFEEDDFEIKETEEIEEVETTKAVNTEETQLLDTSDAEETSNINTEEIKEVNEIIEPEMNVYSEISYGENGMPIYTLDQIKKENDGSGNIFIKDLNGNALKGFNVIGQAIYYMDANGKVSVGFESIEIDGNRNLYWFNSDGRMECGWKNINGAFYNFGDDGKAKNGIVNISGHTYGFVNYKMVCGFANIEVDGKNNLYWFDENGYMERGWKSINGCLYNFGEDGKAKNGIVNIAGHTYGFVNYKMVCGFANIEVDGKNNLYWFDENGYMERGWKSINGCLYNFGEDGKAKNGIVNIAGHIYGFVDYKMVSGFANIEVDGIKNLYWFDENGYMERGWKYINGSFYNFGEDGKAKNGFYEIHGNKYFFDNYRMKTGFFEYEGKGYITNSDGIVKEGYPMQMLKVVKSAYNTRFAGNGKCASWVSDVFVNAGMQRPGGDANTFNMVKVSGEIKPGMVIAVQHSGPGGNSYRYGHIGIYVGDGKVIHNYGTRYSNLITGCTISTLDEWKKTFEYNCNAYWGWALGVDLSK